MSKREKGPYSFDEIRVNHREVVSNTIVNSSKFENIIQNLDNAYDYEVGYIPAGYEHRPDLISNLFYGSPRNWWLLMLVNSISDPFEGFNQNDAILIPKIR